MKVKQLIKQLQKIKNQNADVIVSSDAEGNSFNLLYEVGAETKYLEDENEYPYINIYDEEDLSEMDGAFDTEKEKKDFKKSLKPAVILWPQ